jgi:hypothetical protein
MGVDHRAHVRAPSIGAQVHGQLGRWTPRAVAHGAIDAEFHEILRGQVHLREARRCDKYDIIADANGDIPVLASDEAAFIQATTDKTDCLPDILSLVRGGYPIL